MTSGVFQRLNQGLVPFQWWAPKRRDVAEMSEKIVENSRTSVRAKADGDRRTRQTGRIRQDCDKGRKRRNAPLLLMVDAYHRIRSLICNSAIGSGDSVWIRNPSVVYSAERLQKPSHRMGAGCREWTGV
jgi:hypothetical protein